MNDVSVRYSGPHDYIALDLGGFRSFNPHQGQDHCMYIEAAFDRATVSMSSETLCVLVRAAQEALVAASAVAQRNTRRT